MTEHETKKIIAVIFATYANQYKGFTEYKRKNLISAWQAVFEEYSYQQVSFGLKAFLRNDKKGYAPSPGQVMQYIVSQDENNDLLNEQEAWALVAMACRNGYYGSEEEYSKLPPAVQKAVGSPDNLKAWSQVPADEFNTVTSSNFQRAYRTVVQRVQSEQALPEGMRRYTAQIEDSRYTPAIEQQEEPYTGGVPMPDDIKARWDEMQHQTHNM